MTLFPPAMAAILSLAAATALPVVAVAADKPADPITISNGWFATVPDGPTYGYFQITNRSSTARLLSNYSSPACSSLKLEEAHGGGINSKEPVTMTVAPKNRLVFSRGGYHLVCGHSKPVDPGQTFPVTITLDGGTAITTKFEVRTFPK